LKIQEFYTQTILEIRKIETKMSTKKPQKFQKIHFAVFGNLKDIF
jgi:hypothetical protein